MRIEDESPFVGKDELLARIEGGHAATMQRLAVAPAVFDGDAESDGWSVKDVLAHFIAHEERALAELNAARRGEDLNYDTEDNDAFNARAVNESKGKSFAQIAGAWRVSNGQLRAAVAELTDADFDAHSALCERLQDTVDGALGNNTYGHYAEHTAEVQAWLSAHT